ncbi:Mth938-like domain-containing protein [Pelagibacterium limicola]|uniref:Mth938-like domain-containing protein n=1 Tax=Pelagibacterium limicola TaxID=2791022 RepID=UPI0018AF75E5|nr:MTH938/NDUFAF3 family protein [Pelagibacterium limicola]
MTWEAGQGHYPYQATIDAYGDGGFRFADMSHKGSLICLPGGMYAWAAQSAADVSLDALQRALAVADEIDVLLIGLGPDIAALAPEIRAAFKEKGVIVEAVSTGSAVRTYNVLLAEKRSVGAALIAVEKAR